VRHPVGDPTAGDPPRDLDATILDLLAERETGKTICPSEAARRVGGPNWRERMEPAHQAARRLAADGRIEITQRGRIIDPGEAFRGPIRLRAVALGERGPS